MYERNRLCILFVPADDGGFEVNDEGAYACRADQYFVVNQSTARCVASTAECEGLYVVESMKVCLSNSGNCGLFGAMPYDRTDKKECVT